jgi:fused signal recognition particle receptor
MGFFNQISNMAASLKKGLSKSANKIANKITELVANKKQLDEDTVTALEEILISSDINSHLAIDMVSSIAKQFLHKEITENAIKTILSQKIEGILAKNSSLVCLQCLEIYSDEEHECTLQKDKKSIWPFSFGEKAQNKKLKIILMVGVNGSGKTTSIAKIASKLMDQGHRGVIVCGDTFRAAAVEQLDVWAQKIGIDIIKPSQNQDASGFVYDGIQKAKINQYDFAIIDTAGRLQVQENLMQELAKIQRVIKKVDFEAPHHCFITIDASVGQNAYVQIEEFSKHITITGIIVTKLDTSAKGGVIVGIVDKFAIPVQFIGVGESYADLLQFDYKMFASDIVGLNNTNSEK